MKTAVPVLLLLVAALLPSPARGEPSYSPAPAFRLSDVEGNPFQLEDLRGHVVLLNFWATYCIPCLTELEAYRALQLRHANEAGPGLPGGLRIVAVSVDGPQTVARARSFARTRAFPFPVVLDPEQDAYRLYNVSVMPTSLLIDAEGRIVHRQEGFQPGDEADLERRIEALLAGMRADSAAASGKPSDGPVAALVPASLADKVALSGSNFLRANYGKESRDLPAANGWLEDWFDFRLAGGGLSYEARFRAYQFLRDLPDSRENVVRDPNARVVKQTFAYESERADIRAGNFYGTLNRGLVLRMFEDRQARIDKDVEGAWAALKLGSGGGQRGRVSVFGGKTYARFTDLYALDADEENQRNTHLQGAEGEWEPRAGVRLGAQALEAFRDSWHVRMLAGNGEILWGPTTLYLGYAGLTGQDAFNYPNDFHGRALYGSLSQNWGRLEVGAEYKYYYNYDLGFAEPPSLLKYHTHRLMARDLLFSNNQNERGALVRGAWRFTDRNFYGLNVSTIESHPERNPALLIHHVALPYLDVDQSLQLGAADGSTLLANLDWNRQRRFEAGAFEDIEAATLGLTATRPLPGPWNLQAEAEIQRREVDYRSLVPGNASSGTPGQVGAVTDSEQPWLGVLSATLGRNSAWTFTLDYEMTTSDRARESTWASAYFTLSALAGHQISLWFGQRQERVVCSGGSCRVEPAFEGGELIWITHF
jgi:peroxiredoxin